MSIFDFNVLEVGNPMVLGLIEETNEENAIHAYNHLKKNAEYKHITKEDIDDALEMFDVNYIELTRMAKDLFNEFDI